MIMNVNHDEMNELCIITLANETHLRHLLQYAIPSSWNSKRVNYWEANLRPDELRQLPQQGFWRIRAWENSEQLLESLSERFFPVLSRCLSPKS